MTNDYKKALDVLQKHQKWRKGCDLTPPTDPKELNAALDVAITALSPQQDHIGEVNKMVNLSCKHSTPARTSKPCATR